MFILCKKDIYGGNIMNNFCFTSLTQKELLILALWACSQTVKESAKHLNLSDRTVNYYRGRLRCMLNARSSNEVISKLIMMDDYEALIRFGKMFLTKTASPEVLILDCFSPRTESVAVTMTNIQ